MMKLNVFHKQQYFLETIDGRKIEQKHANYCLCVGCCNDRRRINNMILHQGIDFVYFPVVENCPYGSNYLKRHEQDIEKTKQDCEKIQKLCDSIVLLVQGKKESDR